jgi:hypothetical protein
MIIITIHPNMFLLEKILHVSQLMLVNGFLGREGRGSACPCPSG